MTALTAPEWVHERPAGSVLAPAPIMVLAAGVSAALTAISATEATRLAGGPTAGLADLVDTIAISCRGG